MAEHGEFPAGDMELTHILVVGELEPSRTFYRDVLGATVFREYGGTSCVLKFQGCWLLLVTGGGPDPRQAGRHVRVPARPGHREPRDDDQGAGLSKRLRSAEGARCRVHHAADGLGAARFGVSSVTRTAISWRSASRFETMRRRHRLRRSTVLSLVLAASVGIASAQRVAITFDDLPGDEALDMASMGAMTDRILGALRAHDVPTTGFVTGSRVLVRDQVDERVDLLAQWIRAGAALGNHTFQHRPLSGMTLAEYQWDIAKGDVFPAHLKSGEGEMTKYFRGPP